MSDLSLSPVETVVDAARRRQMFVLVDETGERANVLVCCASAAAPAVINFMAVHARGLICLALTQTQAKALSLTPMASRADGRVRRTMMASIEARDGVTTGISAADRARTIAVAIDSASRADDIVSPGHVFPILAQDGGVLASADFAEGGIDVARLAGLSDGAVICEILDEDGQTACLADLVELTRTHELAICSLQALVRHVYANRSALGIVSDVEFMSRHGGAWVCRTYENPVGGEDFLVLIHGEAAAFAREPTLVYVHRLSLLADVLGQVGLSASGLHRAMIQIAHAGAGVIVLLKRPLDRETANAASAALDESDVAAKILTSLNLRRIVQLHLEGEQPVDLMRFNLAITGRPERTAPVRPDQIQNGSAVGSNDGLRRPRAAPASGALSYEG